jgi:hypothetical protein
MRNRGLFLITLMLLLLLSFSWINGQPIPLPSDPSNVGLQSRAAVELLTNTSFETDNDGDKLPDGWTGDGTSVSKADKRKCNKNGEVVANTGNCAFMFKGNPAGEASKLQQTITNTSILVHGTTLTLSAFVNPLSSNTAFGSKIASAKVKFSDGTKLKLQLRLPANPQTSFSEVRDIELVTIPDGVTITDARIAFLFAESLGKYLVDDASLTVLAAASQAQLLGYDSLTYDNFGWAVSLSADGNTALVGANQDGPDTSTGEGSAYVFVRENGAWSEQQKLVPDNGILFDGFGASVSLSADGNTALIGSMDDVIGGNDRQGSAYIFVHQGDTWTQQQRLITSDGAALDLFGYSVSLSADGNTALVSAYYDDLGTISSPGSAYIFVRDGATWTEQQKLTASDGADYDGFGQSVSLNADGNIALIGSYVDDVGSNPDQGSAYVFVRNGGIWTQQTQLVASNGGASDTFGWSISLNANGDTALISGYYADVGDSKTQGAAYVFTRTGTTWTEQQQLIAGNSESADYFGSAVSLSADGNTALIGAYADDILSNGEQGSAYVFVRNGDIWTQHQQLIAKNGKPYDLFGRAVSLSPNGNTALIGVAADDIGDNSDQGSAWVFDLQ